MIDSYLRSPADPPSQDRYDALDECVKQFVSRKEYAWMPDDQKHTLIEFLTQPSAVE